MTKHLRPIGDPVAVIVDKRNGSGIRRQHPVDGHVVGYAFIHPHAVAELGPRNIVGPQPWVFAYIVRLVEGCDTKTGVYMREIPVYPDDLVGRER
jgi:hypothetical protein